MPMASPSHEPARSRVTPLLRLAAFALASAVLLFGPRAGPASGPAALSAQGFGVYEQGACAMARAGASVARPCADGSALFFNPAALTGSGIHDAPTGWTFGAGGTLIAVSGGFQPADGTPRTELANDPIPVPHVFIRKGLGETLAAGLGVYVPYGLSSRWPAEFDGAFSGFDNGLESIYIQPTLAWQPRPGLSIGGGPVVVIGSVELNQRLDLSEQRVGQGDNPDLTFGQLGIPRGTPFGEVGLEGSGATGLGAHVGLRAHLGDRVELGLRYLTEVSLDYEGDARFTQVETGRTLASNNPFGLPGGTPLDLVLQQALFGSDGLLADQGVTTAADMPAQAVAGLAVDVLPGLTLHSDVQWTGWSSFDEIEIEFETPELNETIVQNYDDTWAIRVGAEARVAPDWTVSAGYLHNTAAAPAETVTPLLPESDRNHITLGAGWQLRDGVRLDAAYQRLMQNDRTGRTRSSDGLTGGPPTTDLNNGLYDFGAHLLGLSLSVEVR